MKNIIITGANGNLGSAVTREFLDKGYKVIATVINAEAKVEMPENGNLSVHVVNLTDEDETAVFISNAIKEHGKIDAALMLVGGFAMGDVSSTSMVDIEKQFSLNFSTAYHVARPLLAHMLQNENGRLVFIGAKPALQPADGKNLVAYSLSKSLLFKLADFINEEGKGKNVTATMVVPSTLDTPLNRKDMPDADPGNWVKPEQLAGILEFVCSERSTTLRENVLKVYNNA